MPSWFVSIWEAVKQAVRLIAPIALVAICSGYTVYNALNANVTAMCVWAVIAVLWAFISWREWVR